MGSDSDIDKAFPIKDDSTALSGLWLKMIGWNPTEYLFDYNLIRFNDTDSQPELTGPRPASPAFLIPGTSDFSSYSYLPLIHLYQLDTGSAILECLRGVFPWPLPSCSVHPRPPISLAFPS